MTWQYCVTIINKCCEFFKEQFSNSNNVLSPFPAIYCINVFKSQLNYKYLCQYILLQFLQMYWHSCNG